MEHKKEWFTITQLHRDDLKAKGFDGSQVSDEQMERLASRIADALMDTDTYWMVIEDFCEDEKVAELPEEDAQ